jgi:hypothetical protein
MSKSSRKRQTSVSNNNEAPEGSDGSRKTIFIAGAAIIIVILAGVWLFAAHPFWGGDPIVGTWTDDHNYWAYAFYSNGSILQLGFYTHKTADTVTHLPVYITGSWVNEGNNVYTITPDITKNNTTFEAIMSGRNMSVVNTSDSTTHKISGLPDVTQVSFNYIP